MDIFCWDLGCRCLVSPSGAWETKESIAVQIPTATLDEAWTGELFKAKKIEAGNRGLVLHAVYQADILAKYMLAWQLWVKKHKLETT